MEQPAANQMTYADFLAFSETAPGDYELVNGRPVAMTSSSKRHDRVVKALSRRIDPHVFARGCDSLDSHDLETKPNGRRPDIIVTCDEHDMRDDSTRAIQSPCLIIEVLSDTTADVDYGDKVGEYQELRSVKEYLLFDSRLRSVRLYYRNPDGFFIFDHDYIAGVNYLRSIDLKIVIDDAYNEARIP